MCEGLSFGGGLRGFRVGLAAGVIAEQGEPAPVELSLVGDEYALYATAQTIRAATPPARPALSAIAAELEATHEQ